MRKRFGWGSVVLVGIVLLAAITSVTAASCGSYSVNYRLGETLLFKVVDQGVGCCCCQPSPTTQVLGWRITDFCGEVIHFVVYAVPIPASSWQGRWPEVGIGAVGKAEAQVEASAPGAVYQAWQKAMSTYEEYWKGVETPVSPGCYVLYVDTSAGTLSRCLRLYDPTNRCQGCAYCPCEHPTVRTSCYCQTTLIVRVEGLPHYRSLSWQPRCSCRWP